MKICPICNIEKPLEEYHKYFSKERQKYRVANYCKPCSREVSKKNATKNYSENKPKKLEYAKKYREENKERIKAKRPYYKKKQIKECQNCYISELLVSKNKIQFVSKIDITCGCIICLSLCTITSEKESFALLYSNKPLMQATQKRP